MKFFWVMAVSLLTLSGCSIHWGTPSEEAPAPSAHNIVLNEPFTSLDVAGPFTITYVKNDTHRIRIAGDPEVLKQLELSNLSGMAHIALEQSSKAVSIEVQAPYLDAIYLAGAITAKFADIKRDVLTVRVAGAYTCTLSGTVDTVRITASGAGAVNAQDLRAQRGDVEASGAATVSVWAEKELHVKAYGATNIQYKGTPQVVQETAGAATIKAL